MIDLDQHLSAIQAGDADAFGRWVAAAESTVRLSLSSFATQVDTEAVLQEALLRVWQVATRFEPDGRPNGLVRFAVRAARNLAVSEKRRLRCVPTPDEAFDAALFEAALLARSAAPDPLLRRVIQECHDKLPEKPARALDARLASGGAEPDVAIAERLAMKLNTFLQNVTRARAFLAECLRGRGVDLDKELT
jgi:RNA polymerase sigma-70 factor (ECF subfamily)